MTRPPRPPFAMRIADGCFVDDALIEADSTGTLYALVDTDAWHQRRADVLCTYCAKPIGAELFVRDDAERWTHGPCWYRVDETPSGGSAADGRAALMSQSTTQEEHTMSEKRFDQMTKTELVQWLKDADAYKGHSRDSMQKLVEHAAGVHAVRPKPVASEDRLERLALAKKEHTALKQWKAAGADKAKRPATPNIDALEKISNGEKPRKAKSTKASRVRLSDAELDVLMAAYIKAHPDTSMSATLGGLRSQGHSVQGSRCRESYRRVIKAKGKKTSKAKAA